MSYTILIATAVISYVAGYFMGYPFGRRAGLIVGRHMERRDQERLR